MTEELLKWIIVIIILLAPGYLVFRICFLAIFKSWHDAKKQSIKEE